MDLNTKIIEGVRQFPALYNNKGDLDERNQSWMQLAEKLKIHEIYLKIRWHALLQAYQRDANFKYAKYMNFVQRKTEMQVKEENWAEFIITEDDLKDDRSGEQEDFVFLEIDGDNKIKEAQQEPPMEKDCLYREATKRLDEVSNESKDEGSSEPETSIQKVEISNKSNAKQNQKTHKSEDNSSSDITSKVEEKMAAVDVNKNTEQIIKETKEFVVENPQSLPTERCEDVIFGELVSAMLKRMEENKKKSIKKEIMNILFS